MKTKDGFEVYQGGGRDERWYWRLRRRGRIVADGSEAYSRERDCWRAVRSIRRFVRTCPTGANAPAWT